MTATCPNGHTSTADDYCDNCGAKIGGAASATPPASSPPAPPAGATISPDVASGDCANCGAPKVPGERFCEVCGLDFDTGKLPQAPTPAAAPAAAATKPTGAAAPLPPPIGWVAVVQPERDWWEHNAGAGGVADGVPFPDPAPDPKRVELRSRTVVIGRASGSTMPDVDCGSADTGVSRRHVQVALADDGSWTITDLGSTNGTFLEGSDERLNPQAETPLPPATRIRIGAYTVISLEEAAP